MHSILGTGIHIPRVQKDEGIVHPITKVMDLMSPRLHFYEKQTSFLVIHRRNSADCSWTETKGYAGC